jgi:hypothetical protein
MGKAQPLEDLLRELAIYEATVSDWAGSEQSYSDLQKNAHSGEVRGVS